MSDSADGLEAPRSMAAVARRRRWSEAEKRRIVAESYRPEVSVAVVARRNAVNANLVFKWRRQYRARGGFVTVVVAPDRLLSAAVDAGAGAATGRMEIALADGSRVIVDREVDGKALGRVLAALARR